MTAASVHVRGLTKSYGSFQAVKGIDFKIFPGEVFGLLGPNGAGKTCTVEILEGLRPRNGGDVDVLGVDPGRETKQLKDRIGVWLQATNLLERITVREAVRLFASLYSRTVDADALLKRLKLWEKRDAAYGKLSGGQKQRLALDAIPDAVFARMAKNGVAYDPTMSVLEAMRDLSSGRADLLRRSLVQQAVSQKLLTGTSSMIKTGTYANAERAGGIDGAIRIAQDNLRRAWKAGVPLVTGSDAGNMLVFHGPTVHRELQLWVEAGLPPAVALQAATLNAAKLLRADGRIGLVAPDHDANLLVVDGDPTRDISATERISMVVLKGERVRRVDLFDTAKNPLQ